MLTPLLLVFFSFFCFAVAGTAATLFIPSRTIAKDAPDQDEAGERLATATEMLAVRAAFDEMLVRKGLVTGDQLDLIRHGTRSRGVVTAHADHRRRARGLPGGRTRPDGAGSREAASSPPTRSR